MALFLIILLQLHCTQENTLNDIFSGENFAVFRSKNGVCHVLDAYCPHVGANMAVGGRVFDDCLECPFHGWRFSGTTGKCVSLPFMDKSINGSNVYSISIIKNNFVLLNNTKRKSLKFQYNLYSACLI